MAASDSPLQRLRDVVKALIAPDGCPWDREQTPGSLCEYVLEEAHELVEAIRHGTVADVREELGDVLFLLVFISTLYEKTGDFSLDDAIGTSAAKMIRRHPHVFADTVFDSKDAQLAAWESIKRSEKPAEDGSPAGVFDSLPRSLPPLLKAYRIHSKAARVGFTWDSDQDVEQQAEAEWLELLEAMQSGDKAAQEHELGDLVFTLVELGRRKGIKASAAVDGTAHRFLNRFKQMEQAARSGGRDFTELDMDELNSLWEAAKLGEKGDPA
ncbi:nucleoside triphosphate pyrophosphohydrolase [Desulfovibrio sp. OttesenSCG-928-A18]|nr:nucleoside triphosphate pyrophosphohydrolase [Desulfovibrio sp. OttesenSCG-928-A18]